MNQPERILEVELKPGHIDKGKDGGGLNPVTAALLEAGFEQAEIAGDRIVTGEYQQWRIGPELAGWLERLSRGEPVRSGTLRLKPITAGMDLAEAPQSWARVTEFHRPPDHHVKFRIEIFCEHGARQDMAQHGLEFHQERPGLEQGKTVSIRREAEGLNPGHTVTYQEYVDTNDPRRNCRCGRCRYLRATGRYWNFF